MIDKLLAEVENLAAERNGEVLNLVSNKLGKSCRFIANFFARRKLLKRSKKLPYMLSVAQHRLWMANASLDNIRRYRCVGTVEDIQAEISDVNSRLNECETAVNATTPCGVCTTCKNVTNRRMSKRHWRKKVWAF